MLEVEKKNVREKGRGATLYICPLEGHMESMTYSMTTKEARP